MQMGDLWVEVNREGSNTNPDGLWYKKNVFSETKVNKLPKISPKG